MDAEKFQWFTVISTVLRIFNETKEVLKDFALFNQLFTL